MSSLNSIGQSVFELESRNGNVDEQTNERNYTNFERNLVMMVIYLPAKFEFDWTQHFRVRVRNRNVDGQTSVQKTYKQTDRITPISKGT